MPRHFSAPVHLYVKTHRVTGLKYFGRTVEDPYSYRGSGAYWTRHLERYGDAVDTQVIGTFFDASELRAAAMSFSSEHNIAASTEWANLLPEDGDAAGDGWAPSQNYSPQIAALDAAVERRLDTKRDAERAVREKQAAAARREKADDSFTRTFFVCLALLAVAGGISWQSNAMPGDGYADEFEFMQFIIGVLVVGMTPLGWIAAGIVAWIVSKLFRSES